MRIQRKWLSILVLVPLLELWGIVMMGQWMGGIETFVLLLLMGLLGFWFIRVEGSKVWRQVQQQLQQGQMPGHTMLDGLCILLGGILLMIPGFISDLVGITLLIPLTRPMYRLFMYRWLERKVRNGSFTIGSGRGRRF